MHSSVCVYVCVCLSVYMFVNVCVCIYIFVCRCVCVCVHVCRAGRKQVSHVCLLLCLLMWVCVNVFRLMRWKKRLTHCVFCEAEQEEGQGCCRGEVHVYVRPWCPMKVYIWRSQFSYLCVCKQQVSLIIILLWIVCVCLV